MKNVLTCLALVLASSALAAPKSGCCEAPKGKPSCCPGPCCVAAKASVKKVLRPVAKVSVVKAAKKFAPCCAGGKCCPSSCCV